MNIGERGPRAVINSCSRCIYNRHGDLGVKQAIERQRENVIICIHTCTGTQLTSHVYPSACIEQADGTA